MHHPVVTVITLKHGPPERRQDGVFTAKQRHRRGFRRRLVQACEVAAAYLAQDRERFADVVFVAAEGPDDIGEDGLVIGPRYAVFSTGGHHEAGKPTQIP